MGACATKLKYLGDRNAKSVPPEDAVGGEDNKLAKDAVVERNVDANNDKNTEKENNEETSGEGQGQQQIEAQPTESTPENKDNVTEKKEQTAKDDLTENKDETVIRASEGKEKTEENSVGEIKDEPQPSIEVENSAASAQR